MKEVAPPTNSAPLAPATTGGPDGSVPDHLTSSSDGSDERSISTIAHRTPFNLNYVIGAIVASILVAGCLIALGAHELNDVGRAIRSERAYDDQILTAEELTIIQGRLDVINAEDEAAKRAGMAPPKRERCADARATYEKLLRDGGSMGGDRMLAVTVPDAVEGSCLIFDERRSGMAGVSVLFTAALGASATLVGMLLWAATLGRLKDHNAWRTAGILSAAIFGLGLFLAGEYQFESHILAALIVVAIAIVPGIAMLMHVGGLDPTSVTPHADDPKEMDVALTRLRNYRLATRAALIALSGIFAVAVAFMAALNARFIATHGQINMPLPFGQIGGIGPGELKLMTAVQGFLFGVLLAMLSLPAIINTERMGSAILEAGTRRVPVKGNPGPVNVLSVQRDPNGRFRRALDRLDVGDKLGLSMRPSQWFERAVALLLPLLTGVVANSLGLVAG